MMWESLNSLWVSAAPAMGRHLWQSTLFAVMAAVMTLSCAGTRRGRATGFG